jgi:NAD(P)-dependent dehydrogenase (short-subunit alcohol dehydrogenase family)
MTSLAGKAIVITGAYGALGAETARAAVRRGARVALIDRATNAPPGLLEACGPGTVQLGGVDLSDAADATQAINAAYQGLRGLDALINIAGSFRWQTIADGDSETWDLLHAINLKTAVNASRAALAHMRKNGGRIINVGANAASKSGAGMGPYAASKAGVHRLTESLAEEVKDLGITVNAVLPSILDTPANRAAMPEANFSKWVTPQALANVILFLASDEASAVTGVLLPVTGRV